MRSKTVAIVSDIHFPSHHEVLWAGFKKWVRKHKPAEVVVLGDIVDLSALSTYAQGANSPVFVAEEIAMAAKEINEILRYAGKVTCVPGNHEERWHKALLGAKGPVLRGIKGLDFQSQMYAQGLSDKVKWAIETCDSPGYWIGDKKVLARHGHKQASGWGVKNIAAKLLGEQPTVSTVVGHHHRAQFMAHTHITGQIFAIANPHMSGHHDYNTMPNWQRGFTVLELYNQGREVSPHIVLADSEGHFAYQGLVY